MGFLLVARNPRGATVSSEIEGFAERLRTLVSTTTQARFAKEAGITQGWLSDLLKGAEPSVSTLIGLAKAGRVSVQWLATGKEVPVTSLGGGTDYGDAGVAGLDQPPYAALVGEFAFIARLEVEASAGGGSLATEEDVGGMLAFRREWLRRVGINPAMARALRARGDSNGADRL